MNKQPNSNLPSPVPDNFDRKSNSRNDIDSRLSFLDRSINSLLYGKNLTKLRNNGRSTHKLRFFIIEEESDFILQWLSKKKDLKVSRIHLLRIKNIVEGLESGKFLKKYIKNFDDKKKIIVISYEPKNKKLYLEFENDEKKNMFMLGLNYFIQKNKNLKILADIEKFIETSFSELISEKDQDGETVISLNKLKNFLIQKFNFNEANLNFLKYLFEKFQQGKIMALSDFKKILSDLFFKKDLFDLYCKKANVLEKENFQMYETHMDNQSLQKFYKKEQGQNIKNEDILETIRKYNTFTHNFLHEINDRLSFISFCNILMSEENTIFSHEKKMENQDMNYPLNNYYINGLLNIFLLKSELFEKEININAYVKALMKGCRYFELSLEEDEDKGEPILSRPLFINHFSKIFFKDFLSKVKENAFISSPYPVILHLSVSSFHCEDKIAENIKEIIPIDLLYTLPKNFTEMKNYPSPKELEKKILLFIKAAIPLENDESNILLPISTDRGNETSEIDEMEERNDINYETSMRNISTMHEYSKKRNINNYGVIHQKSMLLKLDDGSDEEKEEHKQSSYKNNYDQNLMLYFEDSTQNNMPKLKFSTPKKTPNHDFINNFSNYSDNKKPAFVYKTPKPRRITTDNLIRQCCFFETNLNFEIKEQEEIWRINLLKRKKVESFLFDPVLSKIHQTQISLLNFIDSQNDQSQPYYYFYSGLQILNFANPGSLDSSTLVILSKFLENGGEQCGYVLKPNFLLKQQKDLNETKNYECSTTRNVEKEERKEAESDGEKEEEKEKEEDEEEEKEETGEKWDKATHLLKVKFISGNQISKKKDTRMFLEAGLVGNMIEKDKNKVYNVQMKFQNAFNPVFEEEVCEFTIFCPELTMFYFKLLEQNREKEPVLSGWGGIPFSFIRQGYRIFPIRDLSLNKADKCFVFCHVEIINLERERQEKREKTE